MPLYSDEMISEFHQLSEKINQLVALMQTLRRENAALRSDASRLAAENAELAQRMQEAHARVAALLEKLPAATQDEEAV